MNKEITLDEFYQSFIEEVNDAQDTETYGWEPQDFFTSIMMDYLEEAGEVNDPILCPFRGYGLQLNAYSVSDDYECVDIFVSVYNPDDVLMSVSRSIIDATIKRGIQLFRKAVNDLYSSFEKDNDTYGFVIPSRFDKQKTDNYWKDYIHKSHLAVVLRRLRKARKLRFSVLIHSWGHGLNSTSQNCHQSCNRSMSERSIRG